MNLQKSQFPGITESRAGDILYFIAYDISANINNITINYQMVNRVLHCLILKISPEVTVGTIIVLNYVCLLFW